MLSHLLTGYDELKVKSWNHWLAFIASCFLCFIIFVSVEYKLIFGNFLFQDDIIYLSKYIMGFESEIGKMNISHSLLKFLSIFGSITLFKVFWAFLHSFVSGLIGFYLIKRGFRLTSAITVSLLVIFVPISGDQVVFVTGSHPILALVFLVAAVIFYDGVTEGGANRLYSLLGLFTLLVLAAMSSATALLTPLALPIWLFFDEIGKTGAICMEKLKYVGLFLFLAVFAVLFGTFSHHYTDHVGWVDISLRQIWLNFLAATHYSLKAIFTKYQVVHVFFVLLLFCFLWLCVRRNRENIKGLRLTRQKMKEWFSSADQIVHLLVLSLLLFGPISVTTSIQKRYLVAPLTLLLIAMMLMLTRVLNPERRKARILLVVLMLIFVSTNIYRSWQGHDLYLGSFYVTHTEVAGLVQSESATWPPMAQVVILLAADRRNPTDAFNHWSSWYLRLLSGRTDLIGLVGEVQEISRDPFVERYRDHGPEYWEVVEGRSARIRMFGLEKQRALVVYKQQVTGAFEAIDEVVFPGRRQQNRDWRVRTANGVSLLSRNDSENSGIKTFIWPY